MTGRLGALLGGGSEASSDRASETRHDDRSAEGVAVRAEPPYRPAPLSAGVAVVAALAVGAAVAIAGHVVGIGFAIVGLVAVAAGLVAGSVRAVAVGGGALVLGVLASATATTAVAPVLVGGVAAVVAYDAGLHAVELGHQLRADAGTLRLELTRVGSIVAVTVGAAGVGYVAFAAGSGGQPAPFLLLLIVGTVSFVLALR